MNPERRAICLVLAALLLAALPSAGQDKPQKQRKPEKPYALISGTVFTADARLATGVKVKIRRADERKARWEMVSDARGEFAQRIPPGPADYVVWVEVKGRKDPAAEAKVHIEKEERQDIGLHLTK